MNSKWIFILTAFISTVTFAEHSISWYTIDSGGISSGGPYQLTGTIGQPDAAFLGNDQYELLAGFRVGGPRCIVNLEHLAQFAAHWLDGPCNQANNWCGGADLDHLNDVDIVDLTLLANEWLNICPAGWLLQ